MSQPRFRWLEPGAAALSTDLTAAINGPELLAQALVRRGQGDAASARAFLDPDLYTPSPAWQLPGMEAAVERIVRALHGRERICIWGDFDADGQTATAMLVSCLRELGGAVSFHIPIRAEETHGLSLAGLKRELDDGAQLLVTCDTGTSDVEAIGYAAGRSVDVIVTDHHELAGALPAALVLVNPKLLPSRHALRELSGAGVAYKLVEALLERLSELAGSLTAAMYTDLVALGLLADMAVQVADVRYLTQRGLSALRQGGRVGLCELMQVAGVEPARLSEQDVSFALAPRMNALGRLADANLAVDLLTTQDQVRAHLVALQLEELNVRRQLLCQQVFQAAQAQIERDPVLLGPPVLILAQPAWPASVVGIVASRLVQRYGRPAVLIANPPGQPARGSARSVPGCNIVAAIASASWAQTGLLAGYGGHPMAAGFSLPAENVAAFSRALAESVAALWPGPVQPPPLAIDAYLPLASLSLDLVGELGRLAPFGPGNPPPALVSRGLTLAGHATMGRHSEHRQLTVIDGKGNSSRVLWWQGADWPLPSGLFDLAYAARLSDFRGQRQLQVEWLDARPAERDIVAIGRALTRYAIRDLRQAEDPEATLTAICQREALQVWAEGPGALPGGIEAKRRHELEPGQALVVWSVPPGSEELRHALSAVSPDRVYLFARDPGMDEPEVLLKRLAGLAKHVLSQRGGRAALAELAAATAQRQAAVLAGLEWLAASGTFAFVHEGGSLRLETGGVRDGARLQAAAARLRALLAEVAAYRAYYRRAGAEALLAHDE